MHGRGGRGAGARLAVLAAEGEVDTGAAGAREERADVGHVQAGGRHGVPADADEHVARRHHARERRGAARGEAHHHQAAALARLLAQLDARGVVGRRLRLGRRLRALRLRLRLLRVLRRLRLRDSLRVVARAVVGVRLERVVRVRAVAGRGAPAHRAAAEPGECGARQRPLEGVSHVLAVHVRRHRLRLRLRLRLVAVLVLHRRLRLVNLLLVLRRRLEDLLLVRRLCSADLAEQLGEAGNRTPLEHGARRELDRVALLVENPPHRCARSHLLRRLVAHRRWLVPTVAARERVIHGVASVGCHRLPRPGLVSRWLRRGGSPSPPTRAQTRRKHTAEPPSGPPGPKFF